MYGELRNGGSFFFFTLFVDFGDDTLFRLTNLDWVPPWNIFYMMTISYKGLGSSIKGKVLWQTASLSLI